jgi:hypothetical protein
MAGAPAPSKPSTIKQQAASFHILPEYLDIVPPLLFLNKTTCRSCGASQEVITNEPQLEPTGGQANCRLPTLVILNYLKTVVWISPQTSIVQYIFS